MGGGGGGAVGWRVKIKRKPILALDENEKRSAGNEKDTVDGPIKHVRGDSIMKEQGRQLRSSNVEGIIV